MRLQLPKSGGSNEEHENLRYPGCIVSAIPGPAKAAQDGQGSATCGVQSQAEDSRTCSLARTAGTTARPYGRPVEIRPANACPFPY